MIKKYNFPKREHLCGEIRVGKLYADGKSFIVYPLRVVYKVVPKASDVPVSVLVSVPKKRFKHAFNRNRIKRMMRETYRLNKLNLLDLAVEKAVSIQIAFNYVADNEVDYVLLNKKMESALTKIVDKLSHNS